MAWTAVKFANAAARIFDLQEEGKTRLHRVVRNMVAKGVIPTEADPNDGRGALLFDDNVAAVALLMIPMADMDVTVRGMREAATFLLSQTSNLGESAIPGETVTPPKRIEMAMAAVRKGRDADLIISLKWFGASAEIKRTPRLEIAGEGPSGKAAEILRDYAQTNEVLAELRIPASKILSAFFGVE